MGDALIELRRKGEGYEITVHPIAESVLDADGYADMLDKASDQLKTKATWVRRNQRKHPSKVQTQG